MLSGLSVIAVVAGVTLTGETAGPSNLGGSGALPRFYVTLNDFSPEETAIVHSTMTGQALTSVRLSESSGGLALIAPTRSDRVYYLAATGRQPKTGALANVILRLNLSADGRSAKLTRLPIYLTDPEANSLPHVDEIAVSPDGRHLVAIVENYHLIPFSEIIVTRLHSGGRPAIWRAKGDIATGLLGADAFGRDATWVSNSSVAFLWLDQFRGKNVADITGRTAVRLLNVRTSNRNLLKSTVLIRGGGALGFHWERLRDPRRRRRHCGTDPRRPCDRPEWHSAGAAGGRVARDRQDRQGLR